MTNGSGILEKTKAELLNTYLELEGKEKLTEKTVVMPYTPIRSTLKSYSDKVVAISGFGKGIFSIAENTGLKYYITIEEYCSLWPDLMPLHKNLFTYQKQ